MSCMSLIQCKILLLLRGKIMILPIDATYRVVSVIEGERYKSTDYVGKKSECESLAQMFNRSVKGTKITYAVVLSRIKPTDIVIGKSNEIYGDD